MPKVTEEHVEARRRQILSAALRCFAREGFHRATMQDIFREADLSPGAVYSYFNGKDELMMAIVAETMSFVGEAAAWVNDPLPEGRLRRPGEALAEIIDRYRDFELGTVVERARIFPHLVGEQQDRRGHCQAERLGSLDIEDQPELGGQLDRKVGRLGALENSTDVAAGLTIGIGGARLHITFLEAVGRRLRHNYGWIFLFR